MSHYEIPFEIPRIGYNKQALQMKKNDVVLRNGKYDHLSICALFYGRCFDWRPEGFPFYPFSVLR